MTRINRNTASRTAIAFMVVAASLGATNPVMAQALEPVVRGAIMARDTVVAVTLLIMTVAFGTAGWKVAFSGATFRDVSNLVFGGALAGGATALAAVFMG